MLHSHQHHSLQLSYRPRRIYRIKSTAIRYTTPQVFNGQTTMEGSVFYSPLVPVKTFSFLEYILGSFAALWCLNPDGTRRQSVNSGGSDYGDGMWWDKLWRWFLWRLL